MESMIPMLYVKSNYSLLSSLLTIDTIIRGNKEGNTGCAVLCDENMYGTMEFLKKCQAANLKAVLGLEMHLEDHDLLAFIEKEEGYYNLIKLSTLQNSKELTKQEVLQHQKGLIFCLPYEGKSYYSFYEEKLDSLFLGYENKEEEQEGKKITSQVVFLRKCLYEHEKEKDYLKYLFLIRDGKTITDSTTYDLDLKALCDEKVISYSDQEGLDTIQKIIDRCHFTLRESSLLLPLYPCPKGLSAEVYLQELAKKGLLKRLKGHIPKEYHERLVYELDVIIKMGFANYFLVVYDFIRYAKQKGILVGPGRGSAAGSLVAYCLGITEIDPLEYDLLFERFLNPERVSMPDIDTDLPDAYRDDVIAYVRRKYGEKRVAGIVTFATLAAKQVIRDVGRVLNIPLYKIDKLNSYLPAMSRESLQKFYQENIAFRELIERDSTLQRLFQIASKIEGFPRQIGTHAAGIVMCQKDLDEVIPLTKSDDMYLTSYSMNYLEELGLLKMDFLGIKNLTMIMNILEDIKKNSQKEVSFNQIPLTDQAVYQLFSRAETTGIFQFESAGMRNFLRKLKPHNFEDIVAAIALFRPGPASNIDTYIARKEGREKVTYYDPSLEPILKKTYGIMIYQEQIMQTANLYAGYSLGEADILRRAISKKKVDVLKQEEAKFIQKAQEKGHDLATTKEIFSLILKFAGYGFNRSHAVAYSLVAYKMAYLKVHYKIEFYVALLSNVIGVESKTREYFMEIRSHNIKILKPDINESEMKYTRKENGILVPFSCIKGIGVTVCKMILEARESTPFKNIFEAFSRLVRKKVTKKQLETLVLADCFHSFGYSKKALIDQLDALYNYAELTKDLDPSLVLRPELKEEKEYSNYTLLEQEQEVFGFYISNHPTTVYRNKFVHTILLNQLEQYYNKTVTVFVMIEKVKVIKTKKGEDMAFVSGSDETKMMDFTLFPKVYANTPPLKKGDLYLMTGTVEKRFNQTQVIVNQLKKVKGEEYEETDHFSA